MRKTERIGQNIHVTTLRKGDRIDRFWDYIVIANPDFPARAYSILDGSEVDPLTGRGINKNNIILDENPNGPA